MDVLEPGSDKGEDAGAEGDGTGAVGMAARSFLLSAELSEFY